MKVVTLDEVMCSDEPVSLIQGDLVSFIMSDGSVMNTVVKEVGAKETYCSGCVFSRILDKLGYPMCPSHVYEHKCRSLICSRTYQNVDIKFLDSTELI